MCSLGTLPCARRTRTWPRILCAHTHGSLCKDDVHIKEYRVWESCVGGLIPNTARRHYHNAGKNLLPATILDGSSHSLTLSCVTQKMSAMACGVLEDLEAMNLCLDGSQRLCCRESLWVWMTLVRCEAVVNCWVILKWMVLQDLCILEYSVLTWNVTLRKDDMHIF